MRRFTLLLIAPTVGFIVLAAWPLIGGSDTLYYRDFLTSHLPLKAAHAQLLADGHLLPLIDPYRSGGQPLLGNPNALPLYPTNLIFLVTSPIWALNAHIWLHWLLAPFAFYWLGRAWGLGRISAWAAGAVYATSGFFLSLFNLYNLIAAAALTPALIAACLEARRGLPYRWPITGLLWTLILLGGDPLYAALAAAMALSTWLLATDGRHGPPAWRRLELGQAAAAFGLGILAASPMLVEMLRILPASFRGHWRYGIEAALAQSWDPRSSIEWLLPFFYGPLDYDFWGRNFFGGNPPLLYSLYPGTLAVALVIAAGLPRRGDRRGLWAWGWIGAGGFLALGYYNPIMHLVYDLPGASALRYPVKVWLVVAVAASLLAGIGLEKSLRGGGLRLRRLLAAAAIFYGLAWLLLIRLPAPVAAALQALEPQRLQGDFFASEHLRWTTTCFFVLLVAMAAWLFTRRIRQRPSQTAALLVALHVLSQIFLLQPLFDTDEVEPYVREPAMLAYVGEHQRAVHGAFEGMFGSLSAEHVQSFPDRRFFWLTRETFTSMGHFAGVLRARRYELNHSPEGLDTFLSISLTQSLARLDDLSSVRVLAASGVDRLFLHRPLEGVPGEEATLLHRESGAWTHHVYALHRALPEFALAGNVGAAPHLNAALEAMVHDGFDGRTAAVVRSVDLPAPIDGPPGRVDVLENELERFVVELDSEAGGVLVTRRAHLPIYRARIDGEPARIAVANLHKLGVVVPAGRHRVEVWVDRRPTVLAASAASLALLALALWLLHSAVKRRASSGRPQAS